MIEAAKALMQMARMDDANLPLWLRELIQAANLSREKRKYPPNAMFISETDMEL